MDQIISMLVSLVFFGILLLTLLLPFFFMALSFALLVGSLALMGWALVDCLQRQPDAGNVKVLWLLAILLGSPVGALAYALVARQPRQAGAAPAPR